MQTVSCLAVFRVPNTTIYATGKTGVLAFRSIHLVYVGTVMGESCLLGLPRFVIDDIYLFLIVLVPAHCLSCTFRLYQGSKSPFKSANRPSDFGNVQVVIEMTISFQNLKFVRTIKEKSFANIFPSLNSLITVHF